MRVEATREDGREARDELARAAAERDEHREIARRIEQRDRAEVGALFEPVPGRVRPEEVVEVSELVEVHARVAAEPPLERNAVVEGDEAHGRMIHPGNRHFSYL